MVEQGKRCIAKADSGDGNPAGEPAFPFLLATEGAVKDGGLDYAL